MPALGVNSIFRLEPSRDGGLWVGMGRVNRDRADSCRLSEKDGSEQSDEYWCDDLLWA